MAGASGKKQATVKNSSGKGQGGKTGSRSNNSTGSRSGNSAGRGSTGNSSAGRSSTGAKGGARKGKSVPEENSFMGTEVAIIVSFAISVLLFLSNFHLCGAVGDICRGFLLGVFGSVGYIAPILLFAGTCFYMSNRGDVRAVIKMAAVGVVLLSLCGLAQLILGGGYKDGQKLLEYYSQSGTSGKGGGLIGGILVSVLTNTIGTIGSYLILFVILAIGAVCITEKSLVNFVKRGSGRAYQYAREDIDRRKMQHEERREERRLLREEQKVRGVNFDATSLTGMNLARGYTPGVPSGARMPEEGDLTAGQDGFVPMEPENGREQGMEFSRPTNPADVFRGSIAVPTHVGGGFDAGAGSDDIQPERGIQYQYIQDRQSISGRQDIPDRQDSSDRQDISDSYDTLDRETENEKITSFERSVSARRGSRVTEQPDRTDVYISRDTRTLEEMSLSEQDFDRSYFDKEDGEEDRFADDDFVGEVVDAEDAVDENGFYEIDPVEEESGVNYDSFFIPEEPKTVVTASGKVIETDTEMVKKTLERKRAEQKAGSGEEMSVSEQIHKKEEVPIIKKEYIFPPISLLKKGAANPNGFSEKEYRETAIKLQQTLQNFGVGVTVTNISCGPSVTRYELHPEQGVKVSKIVALADDIKLNLAAADIRIEAPIPGKAAVGIEVPNKENNVVLLRDLLESEAFKKHTSRLAFAVGKDIAGQTVVTDIAKMPHLLIAGATGSGKSVCINTLIMSVIYKANPEDVKLIMIDPKVVELSVYNGIPHLLIPVVTDPKKASGALNWAVAEMTDRYNKFAQYNVRDLKGFNEKVESIKDIVDDNKPEKLPQIIIIVDELADLMMVAPGEVEDAICRLAQLARAAGIHLVIATQRPSVNVITGLIKANIPSRIAFSVSSGVDSRTIIDMNGAEKLLGKGDMLFYPAGVQKPQRVQGAFVSDQEVSKVVEFLTEQGQTVSYNPEVESKIANAAQGDAASGGGDRDAYFVQAGRFIIEKDKASIGMLQRMFKIGFNRAARIMDQLADAGIVGEEEGTKPRKVLMSMEQFENMMDE